VPAKKAMAGTITGSGATDDGFQYKIYDSSYVTIPDKVDGVPVTSIGDKGGDGR
jgi:hypothetical protein